MREEQTTIGEVVKVQTERRNAAEEKEHDRLLNLISDAFGECSELLDRIASGGNNSIAENRRCLINLFVIKGIIKNVQNLTEKCDGLGEISLTRSRFKNMEKVIINAKGIAGIVEGEDGEKMTQKYDAPKIYQEFPVFDLDAAS